MTAPFETFGYVTQKDYGAFVRFNILKGRFYRLKAAFAALVLAAAVITLLALGLATKNRDLMIAAGIILLSAGMGAYMIKVQVRNVCRRNAKAVRGKQHILFGKNGLIFELKYQNSEDDEYTDVLYEEIDFIYETRGYYYIYVDKHTIMIAPKRSLRVSVDEANRFLQEFVPDKYVVCL